MNDLFVLHVLQSLHYLVADPLQQRLIKDWLPLFVYADILVKIHVQVLENYNHVLAEIEAVFELHDAIVALVVRTVIFVQFLELGEELYLNVGIIHIKLLILANLRGHDSFIRISAVGALDHLAKGAFINDLFDQVSVAEVLAHLRVIEAILVGDRILIFPSHVTDRVNSRVVADLDLLELGELMAEHFKCFLRTPPVERLVFSLQKHGALATRCLGRRRLPVMPVQRRVAIVLLEDILEEGVHGLDHGIKFVALALRIVLI